MPTQDTTDIRKKIISFIRIRGPSLPVHIAKETNMSILFASAFLSELIYDKELKVSYMKVGNSPLYLIPGQEPRLENFSQHLQSKEKDAFILLKQKKILKDKQQEPAIRVALRSIKDFAIPFKRNDEIYWRYYLIPETEFKEEPKKVEEKPIPKIKEKIIETKKESKEDLGIFDKVKKITKKKEFSMPKPKKKTAKKQNEKFFEKVKEFLSKKEIEISGIESFSKNELILRIKNNGKEELLVACNKKRITEDDFIKASKKATELNIPYIILNLGEPSKKLKDFLIATKNLSKIDKLE